MLKLLVFLPCERVLVTKEESTSVVSVLEQVVVDVPEDTPLTPTAATFIKWSVLTIWRRDDEVGGQKDYEQLVDVISPDGRALFGIEMPFTVYDKFKNHRVIVHFGVLPTGIVGELVVRLYLREAGENNEWLEVSNYPVNIAHRIVKAQKQDEESTTKVENESTAEPQV